MWQAQICVHRDLCCSSRGHRRSRAAPAAFTQKSTRKSRSAVLLQATRRESLSTLSFTQLTTLYPKCAFPHSPLCAAPARPSGAAGQPEGRQHPPAPHGAQAPSPRCCARSTGLPAPVLAPQPPRWPAQRPCKRTTCLAQPVMLRHPAFPCLRSAHWAAGRLAIDIGSGCGFGIIAALHQQLHLLVWHGCQLPAACTASLQVQDAHSAQTEQGPAPQHGLRMRPHQPKIQHGFWLSSTC